MLLFYSKTSPYARKVRLVIAEKDLHERVELRVCDPFVGAAALTDANPLGRVPTLITDDGQAIYDSPVICGYLDSLNDDPVLLPRSGMERWLTRRREAMADGIIDAAYAIVMERRRPAEQQSAQWLAHWAAEIERGVQVANDEVALPGSSPDLGQLALAAALGYLDFRLSGAAWREGRRPLADWYEAFARRSSMCETEPA